MAFGFSPKTEILRIIMEIQRYLMNTILRTPLNHPSVWRGRDLQSDGLWSRTLKSEDISTLESAKDAATGRPSTSWKTLLRDTHVGSLLDSLTHDLTCGRGFAVLRGLPAEKYTMVELENLYFGLGSYMGTVIPQNSAGEMIGRVADVGAGSDAARRGYLTRAALAPHSDVGDLVGLLCVRKARIGGLSLLVSSMTIYNHILSEHPEYLEVLYDGYIEQWLDSSGRAAARRNPVYDYRGGQLSCSFHPSAIRNGHAKSGIALTPLELDVMQYIQTLAMRPDLRLEMDLRPGDIQFLNNRLILHSRSAFEDYDEPERKRLLLRMWINLPETTERNS
jgi:hypothetical protein